MPWEAKTQNATIKVGTRLFVLEVPQVDGKPTRSLPGLVKLPIAFQSGAVLAAETLDRTGDVVILELPDGTLHEMTPRRGSEYPSGIAIAGMIGEDWIIRQ